MLLATSEPEAPSKVSTRRFSGGAKRGPLQPVVGRPPGDDLACVNRGNARRVRDAHSLRLVTGAHVHPLLQIPEHVLDLRQRRAQVVGDLLRQQVRLGETR